MTDHVPPSVLPAAKHADHDSPVRPVILCGGSGTRLWPAPRERMPKQFS